MLTFICLNWNSPFFSVKIKMYLFRSFFFFKFWLCFEVLIFKKIIKVLKLLTHIKKLWNQPLKGNHHKLHILWKMWSLFSFFLCKCLCVFTCVWDYVSLKNILQNAGTLVAVPGILYFPVQMNTWWVSFFASWAFHNFHKCPFCNLKKSPVLSWDFFPSSL